MDKKILEMFKNLNRVKEDDDSIIEKFEYLNKEGIEAYIDCFTRLLDIKNIEMKTEDKIVEVTIPKTMKDLSKKVKEKEYYTGHLCCIQWVFEKFFSPSFVLNYKKHKGTDELVTYNYFKTINALLLDMKYLIKEYIDNFAFQDAKLSRISSMLGKSYYEDHFDLHNAIMQQIYGQSSFHSASDKNPFIAKALIRQVVEFRVKRGLGIWGYIKDNGDIYGISLSELLKQIKKLKKKGVEIPIDIDNMIRINGWCNLYVHSGFKDYFLSLIFISEYIRQFIKSEDGKYDRNSGLKITKNALDIIKKKLRKSRKGPTV